MKKSNPPQFDIPAVRPTPRTLTSLNEHGIAAEADLAVVDHFMEATIAAAMIIAHADGEADRGETASAYFVVPRNPAAAGLSGG